MLNPDDLRSAFEARGEDLVRLDFDNGVMNDAVANVAGRWLATKASEGAERHDALIRTQHRMLMQIRSIAYLAALTSLVSAVLSYLSFMRHR